MSILEKIEQFFSESTTSSEAQFIQRFEEKLPESLRGIFVYKNFWTNGWSFETHIEVDGVAYILSWNDGSKKYKFWTAPNVQVPYTLLKLEAYVNR